MKLKCKKKKINVSQKPLPQTSTVYIFLDIELWTRSLSHSFKERNISPLKMLVNLI